MYDDICPTSGLSIVRPLEQLDQVTSLTDVIHRPEITPLIPSVAAFIAPCRTEVVRFAPQGLALMTMARLWDLHCHACSSLPLRRSMQVDIA
jgi:hypothetical protein